VPTEGANNCRLKSLVGLAEGSLCQTLKFYQFHWPVVITKYNLVYITSFADFAMLTSISASMTKGVGWFECILDHIGILAYAK
jgi:hypothetical protein